MPGSPAIERCTTAFIYSLVLPAVPLFVLLSGAFILTHDKTINAWEFYKHSLRKLFPISCFFFAIYLVWKTRILHNFLAGKCSFVETLRDILQWYGGGASAPLWYLCMLPGLYLMAPLLSLIRKKVSLLLWGGFSLLLLFLTLLIQGEHWNFFHPLSAITWLGFFCSGAWLILLERKNSLPSGKICFIALFFCIIITTTIYYIFSGESHRFYDMLGKHSWIFNAATAILLFALFCRWHPKDSKLVARLSELSLLIYLMHILVQTVIRSVLFRLDGIGSLHCSIWTNLFYAVGSILLTCLAAWMASWAWKKMRASGAFLRRKVLKPHT